MTAFAAPSTTPLESDLPRDRWGRPLITPTRGGEPRAYTRATTLAKATEDTYHLTRWQVRMAVLGMAKCPDLVLAAGAVTDPGDTYQKRLLNELGDKAKDAAAPSAARIGTALHTYTERLDQGEPLSIVPEQYRADLAAYRHTIELYGLEPVTIEGFVVHDGIEAAGTFDRIYRLTRDLPIPSALVATGSPAMLPAGTHIIGDVKTGSTVELGAMAFAIQLAIYANGTPYDHSTGKRTAHPATLSRDLALIMHMPVGRGTVTPYWLDIARGVQLTALAAQVRDARSGSKTLISAALPASSTDLLAQQINECQTIDALLDIWRSNRMNWTDELSGLAAARRTLLTKSGASST